jgi:hypothetical protein
MYRFRFYFISLQRALKSKVFENQLFNYLLNMININLKQNVKINARKLAFIKQKVLNLHHDTNKEFLSSTVKIQLFQEGLQRYKYI